MLRVVQARHYPKDRQNIARHLVARGCRTDILMAAALGDLELVRRQLSGDPACIHTRVSEALFPKGNPRSSGTIYIQLFGADRTPHQIARDFGHEEVFQFLMESSPEDVKWLRPVNSVDEETFRALLAEPPESD